MVLDAYAMMIKRSKTDIKKKHQPGFLKFAREFVETNWIDGRYAIEEFNEYRKQIATDNYAEATNFLVIKDLGVHSPMYLWLWNLTKFSAKHNARYRRYKIKGFERKTSVDEHMRLLYMKHLWDGIGNSKSGLSVYDYMRAASYVYRKQWQKVKNICGEVEFKNDSV
eukprot:347530_1